MSTFKQDGVGGLRGGYEYSRSANPTRTALEECLAAIEGGTRAFAFASGLAAEDTLLRAACKPGDHVVIPDDAYGGTFRLISQVLTRWGVDHTPVPLSDPDAVRAALRPTTTVVWVETPTNPLLAIADIAQLAAVAHEAGALLVVDNTFASPYLQQPLALGADVVVHSTTKYLGGHSDVVGGALDRRRCRDVASSSRSTRTRWVRWPVRSTAGWCSRGIKTLAVRMDRHNENAAAVAAMLQEHPKVGAGSVPRPSRPPRPRDGGQADARVRRHGLVPRPRWRGAALDVVNRTDVFTLAESLGGVESLIEHPGRMTHASVAGSPLEVPDDLVRLSVGIEHVRDLVEDLQQALG